MRRAVCPSVAVTLLVLLTACEGQSGDPPAQRPSQSTTIWGLLGAWSGSGDRQTESFDVTSGALRLSWGSRGRGDARRGETAGRAA